MVAKKLLYILIVYCFIDWFIARETSLLFFPLGIAIEALLIAAMLIGIFAIPKEKKGDFNNDLFYLCLFWFILSILEVANPAGASVDGWIREIRAVAEYPFLIVFVSLLIFNTTKDLDTFLTIIIVCSTIGALDGIKQLYIGLSHGDQMFLANGGAATHLLWGRLRVFSFYSEAAQFGSSQAQIGLMALILAFGPIKKKTKIILLVCSGLMLYGMLISGTRGAFFALFPGAFVAIIISKKFKVLLLGGAVFVLFFCFLKFTTIGNGNYQIYRFRSSLDPNDASLNVRFNSQRILKSYMSDLPFGGGLGVIGANGMQYNPDKFLATVQPDSYWVKLWAMYGIVGFTIWICIMTYILGKCCAFVWKIKDEALKVKANALVSGVAGILMCSYGNEIINTMPSTIVVYISLAFLYKMPKLEQDINERKLAKDIKQGNAI